MGSVWIGLSLILVINFWESSAITNKDNRRSKAPEEAVRNFRHIENPTAYTNTDWEVGLREAANQALLREKYHAHNLRDRLLRAPLIGKQDFATPFGDVAIVARGQLYVTADGDFVFIQDAYQNDCEGCHITRRRCTRCEQVFKSPQDEQLVALWTVKRLRHRDYVNRYRYETEYTISPIGTPLGGAFVPNNHPFDYAIPGHVFVIKHDVGTTTRSPIPPPVVYNQRVPHTHFRPEVLIGIGPDGRKHFLHSYPGFYTTFPVHPTDQTTNDPKEIELYKALIEALASKTSTTQKIEDGPHRFSLNNFGNNLYTTEDSFTPLVQLPTGEMVPLTDVTSSATNTKDPVLFPEDYPQEKVTKPIVLQMVPTRPTDLSTTDVSQSTETTKVSDVTRPITTVHYFAPAGEEHLVTQGNVDTHEVTSPMREDGADFLFPLEKTTATPKTTKKYKPAATTTNVVEVETEEELFPEQNPSPTRQSKVYHPTFSVNKTSFAPSSTTTASTTSKSTAQMTASETTPASTKATTTTAAAFTTTPTAMFRTTPTTSKTTLTTIFKTTPTFRTTFSSQRPETTPTAIFRTTPTSKTTSSTTFKTTPTSERPETTPSIATFKTIPPINKLTAPMTTTTDKNISTIKLPLPTNPIVRTFTTSKFATPQTSTFNATPTTTKFTVPITTARKILPPVLRTSSTALQTEKATSKLTTVTSKLPPTTVRSIPTTSELTTSETTTETTSTSSPKTTPTTLKATTSITFNAKTPPLSSMLTTITASTSKIPATATIPTTNELTTEFDEDEESGSITQTKQNTPTAATTIISESPISEATTVTLKPLVKTTLGTLQSNPTDLDLTSILPTTSMEMTAKPRPKVMDQLQPPSNETETTAEFSGTVATPQSVEDATSEVKETTTKMLTPDYPTFKTIMTSTTSSTIETTKAAPEKVSSKTGATTVEEKEESKVPTTTESFMLTDVTTAVPSTISTIDDFFNEKITKTQQKPQKDLNEDDIFGSPEEVAKPTMATTMKITESEFAGELFGNKRRSPKMYVTRPTQTKDTKIIFADFYEASTASITKEDEDNDSAMKTDPLTSQSYATSISFKVNKKTKTTPNRNEKENIMADNATSIDNDEKSDKETSTMSGMDDRETRQAFDTAALQLVNHVRSINYLNADNGDSTTRVKYKRRRTYIPKSKRPNTKRNRNQ